MELLFEEEAYTILGACFEVEKDKGCGFLEGVYQGCLAMEFSLRKLPLTKQAEMQLTYKGQPLKLRYVPDLICYEKIILEIKATTKLVDEHRAQVHNYLTAAGFRLDLLVNFDAYPKLQHERIIRQLKS